MASGGTIRDVNPAGAPPAHLESLQYLRGIAAMMVVYYHAQVQIEQVVGLSTMPAAGGSGVDIFFVLSGFVMWWTTQGRQPSAGDFLLKRVIRIAPPYWLFTLLAGAIALFLPQLLRSTQFDALHLGMSLLFLPWWNPTVPPTDPVALTPVIVPGWTLNVEMAFYCLFALSLAVGERWRVWVLAALLALLFVAARTLFAGTPLQFYGTDLLAEFLAGVLLARLIMHVPARGTAGWTGLFAIAFAALLYLDFDRPSWPQCISLGIPALLCVIAALQVERGGALPRSRLLSLLGDASYSIYVSHVFVIPGARMASRLVGFDMALFDGALFVALAMIGAALFGIAFHLIVEKPMLAVINRRLRGVRRPPASAEFVAR